MGYTPAANTSSLVFNLGTVYGCSMTGGSPSGSPNCLAAGAFSSADIGRTATVIGAGPNDELPWAINPAGTTGSLLKATVVSLISGGARLSNPAITTVTPNNNLTVYRPIGDSRNWVMMSPGFHGSWSLTQKGVFSFTVWSSDGSLQPLRGQPVWIYDSNPDNTGDVFGGYIDKITRVNVPNSRAIQTTCECIDWAGVLTRRLVGSYNSAYSGESLSTLAFKLVYNHANAEGFVVNSVTGPTGLSASYDYSSDVGAALDDACSRSYGSGYSYYWFVNPWKVIYLVRQDTHNAAWSIKHSDGSDGNVLIQISVTETGEKKANRVHTSGQELTATPVTEVLLGNGSKRTFDVANSIGYISPTAGIVLNPGAHPQTVGALNIDTGKDWYWSQGSSTLTQDIGGTTLTSAQSLSVTYQSVLPAEGWNQYNAGVAAAAAVEGGTGFHDLSIDLTNVGPSGTVQSLAVSSSASYSDDPLGVEVKSYRGGLHVADLVPVDLPEFGINASFLMDTVTVEAQENLALWTYHMTVGPLLGDWRDPFVDLIGGGVILGGSGGSGGSGGGSTVAPSGLTYTPALYTYGYFSLDNVAVAFPVDLLNIDWYLIVIDELNADRFLTTGINVNNSTDPLTLTVAESVSGAGTDYVVGDWILWNDQGAYEWNQLTAITPSGGGNYSITLKRAYPGVPAGQATFESFMNAHLSGTKLFRGLVRRFLPNSQTGGFAGSPPPTRYDFGIPAVCVGAVVAAPVGLAGYGPFVVYNCATATLPGIRTCIGGEFSFQLAGNLTASAGTNRAVPFQVSFDQPIRVNDAYVTSAPTGADLKVKVRRSSDGGTTWATIEQLVVLNGQKTSWSSTPTDPPENRQAPYNGSWPFPIYRGGDLLDFSVEQVGSTFAGADLTVKSDT